MAGQDERIDIQITADPSQALRAMDEVLAKAREMAKILSGVGVSGPGGGSPSPRPASGAMPPGVPPAIPPIPAAIPPVPPAIHNVPTVPPTMIPARPGTTGTAPSVPGARTSPSTAAPQVPAAIPPVPSSIWQALKQTLGLGKGTGGGGASGAGGAGGAVRQIATSGQSIAMMLFPNAAAGAEFLRAQGWSSSHIGTPQGVAATTGVVGGTAQASGRTSTARAVRQASMSPLVGAVPQNAGGAPSEVFATLLATSGALSGPAASHIRSIAARGTYGTASPADLQALQTLKAATAPDLQAQVEALRAQRTQVAASVATGKYKTAAAQSGAKAQLSGLDQKIGNLVAAMSALDEATAAATAALAVTGASGGGRGGSGRSARSGGASRGSSVASTIFGVAKRTASALGPIAGIASLGFVGASVGSYWQMANEAGRAWARAGQNGGFNPYFSVLQNQASQTGYTIPVASSALSAASLYSGNAASALGTNAGVLRMARALGLDPQTAGQVLGQIASYGAVGANGQVGIPAAVVGGRALSSGIDPRQYLSALAAVTQAAGQSNANVSAASTSSLLSSAGMLASATGLSMFRGTRGASWLQSFQGATQQGLGGNSGEMLTLNAIQAAYGSTHGGKQAGLFHLAALQSAGPLGWGSRPMVADYVQSLQKQFAGMGSFGQFAMAQALGMTPAQYYALEKKGGTSAVVSALMKPVASSSATSAAKSALGTAGGGSAQAAAAESAISSLTASIGQGLSPAVVGLTKKFKQLDSALINAMGKKGAAWTLLIGGALTGSGIAGAVLGAGGEALISQGAKALGTAGAGTAAGAAGAVGADAVTASGVGDLATAAGTTVGSAALPVVAGAGALYMGAKVARMAAPGLMDALLGPKWVSAHNMRQFIKTNDPTAAKTIAYINKRWGPLIGQASMAAKTNLPPTLLAAIMAQESRGNPNAVSGAGAQGLMQLMPGTAKDLGVTNAFNPTQNVMAAMKYISSLQSKYAKYGSMDLPLALAAYNGGPGAVSHDLATLQARGEAVTWQNLAPLLPKQTQNYVPGVLGWQQAFAGGTTSSATVNGQPVNIEVTVNVTPGAAATNPS